VARGEKVRNQLCGAGLDFVFSLAAKEGGKEVSEGAIM
jgi:hypothetical protein